jgi:hypothetical protein
MARGSVAAVFSKFESEIKTIISLDQKNQSRLWTSAARPRRGFLTRTQLESLTEGLLIAGFRAFDVFLNDVFLLYCCGRPRRSGGPVVSFLNTKHVRDAADIIQGEMKYLD